MKSYIKQWILLGILWGIVMLQSVSSVSANLTISEQSLINTYIQRRSTRYTPAVLSTKALRIQERIQFTLTTSSVNDFTTDILTYIDDKLDGYTMVSPNTPTPWSPVITPTTPATTTPSQPWTSTPSQIPNTTIRTAIQEFEDDREVVLLAWMQNQVVAEFELNARLENFMLEELTIQAWDSAIDQSVSQLHLYTEQWVKIWSDRPNNQWEFEFKALNHLLEQWTTKIYAVMDTMMVGYNGNSQNDKLEFSLRIIQWEATGEFSSTTYQVWMGKRSMLITIQSVLIEMIEFVDSWEWARVNRALSNGENTLGIIKISTANSQNNETSLPRDLDIILKSLTLQINDNTVWSSARNSLVLRRLDRNWNDIAWTVVWDDTVTFNFDTDDQWSLIDNWTTAYYRVTATDVQLSPAQWESVRLELEDARVAITYTSTDPRSSTFTRNANEFFLISSEQISD